MKSAQLFRKSNQVWRWGMCVCFLQSAPILFDSANAATPPLINYQAAVSGPSGPLDTTVNVIFSIYDGPSSLTPLWSETHNSLVISEGRLSVLLGTITPISDQLFSDTGRYIGIKIGGDNEMSPRSRLLSVPYALRLETIDGASGGNVSGALRISPDPAKVEGDALIIANANGTTILSVKASTQGTVVVALFDPVDSKDGFALVPIQQVEISPDGIIMFDSTGLDTTIIISSTGDITGSGQILVGPNSSGGTATTVFGANNTAGGDSSTISGGTANSISALGHNSTIGGGRSNTINSEYGTINGGWINSLTVPAYYSTIGGGINNQITDDHATIGGGNSNYITGIFGTVAGGADNRVIDSGGFVGGGQRNRARGRYSVVSGGGGTAIADSNSASGMWSTISGGTRNVASGDVSMVSGGSINSAISQYSGVGGGFSNSARERAATVGGGWADTAKGTYSGVASGYSNLAGDDASDTGAFVGGGHDNMATDKFATVAGGFLNSASEIGSTVGGGGNNTANGVASTIGGGSGNSTSASDGSTVSGGFDNASTGYTSTVGGGSDNAANGGYSSVGGGNLDTAKGDYSGVASGYSNLAGDAAADTGAFVGGGNNNMAIAKFATVSGGQNDTASGNYSTVPGGSQNKASGAYSFAAGRKAKATHSGSFVWSGDTFDGSNFSSSATNQFNVRASGGVRIYTNDTLATGVTMGAGASAWSPVSDKSVKKDFREINSDELLEKLAEIPISRWKYIAEVSQADHIGPMSQDFYSAFGLGDDDKRISTIDADGVALAAIQELYKQVQELKAEIKKLKENKKD